MLAALAVLSVQEQMAGPASGPVCARSEHPFLLQRGAVTRDSCSPLSRDTGSPLASCANDAENTQVELQILRTFDPDSTEALGMNLGRRGCSSLWLTPACPGWWPHVSCWVTVLYGCSSLDRLGVFSF